mmetsp:Transcript_44588/g.103897  ORF Transcript_44588/g.103897 Transcript_44588/m.103897 type:complete len:85 (+) Transcript_44588:81-335(+)
MITALLPKNSGSLHWQMLHCTARGLLANVVQWTHKYGTFTMDEVLEVKPQFMTHGVIWAELCLAIIYLLAWSNTDAWQAGGMSP